ncbi:DinB family protein [Sinomicrobium soli]|uniref:DinB family protein n=1 Tax=Sinomicrobium sp. N-1-3-6 TaxID=2219864 RepID=UPI001374BD7C|nr:DinB family protein [Sinomicrobium sp. N-1-3-6]
MKILKAILIVLVVLIALPLIAAVFVKKDYAVEREVTVDKPVKEVFEYVKYLKNQDDYSKWASMDPDMETSYSGTDGTEGFVSAWSSTRDDVGSGEQEIVKITEGERIDYELRFFEPFESVSPAYMTTGAVSDGQTRVAWGIEGHMNYPMNLMLLFMDFDSIMGADLQTGLDRLEEILESRKSVAPGSKEYLLGYLQQTVDTLKGSVSALSETQLQFSPAKDRWSVSQCLEHIVITENMLFGMVLEQLKKPVVSGEEEKDETMKLSDEELIAAIKDRSQKAEAPAELQGEGKYNSPGDAIRDLEAGRKAVQDYIENTSVEALRDHILEFPFGKVDGYQALLFVPAHTARHTLQIEEVKADPGFPED